jgi:iron uptake system component EfeO
MSKDLVKAAVASLFLTAAAACGATDDGAVSADAGAGADAAGKDAGGGADGAVGADLAAADPQTAALLAVKSFITQSLDTLLQASTELQAAAPAPDDDGWSATTDKAALDSMKTAWSKARQAYEHVEGAIALLFPELDVSTDERYDGFLADAADDNPFDGEGITGIHAIERILWADQIRPEVVTFESALKGYQAAAFPKTRAEAEDFKTKLTQRLITDITMLRDMFKPLALDPAAAYRGVIGSLGEQIEKITKAESGEEESRYANLTLADMRYNVEGGQATHAAFRPWLLGMPNGAALDTKITAGFARIEAAYGAATMLPAVPTTWNETKPSDADLATPFGMLFGLLSKESDGKDPDSLVTAMNQAATAMGIKTLP